MSTLDFNSNIIDGYLRILENLSPSNKLELIARLSDGIKKELNKDKSRFENAYGAWESKESAEEIIKEIRGSRNFNRQIESF